MSHSNQRDHLIINELHRQGKLQEARRAGEEALTCGHDNLDALTALIDVYIDIERQCIETGVTHYMPEISRRLEELLDMHPNPERQRDKHRRTCMKLTPGYHDIERLEEMSAHDGREEEAYSLARQLYESGKIAPALHQVYGTILYRYARIAMTKDESRPVRSLLLQYLNLSVPHPSRLHSLMLRLAVRVARRFTDFNFTRFFELWNPATFREEDLTDPEGKSSLASLSFELVIDSDLAYELPRLVDMLKCDRPQAVNIIRGAYRSMVSRAVISGETSRAIDLLELYSRHQGLHEANTDHSRLLNMALKVMDSDELWRFPEFFANWGPQHLHDTDLQTTDSNGETIPSLATRAFARCIKAMKSDPERYGNIQSKLLDSVNHLIETSVGDIVTTLERHRAMLLKLMDREEDALEQISHVAAFTHATSAAFWLEYATYVDNPHLQLSVLAHAMTVCRHEDPDRPSLMLRLTQLLHIAGYDEAAATSIMRYEADYVTDVAAEPSARYGAVKALISDDISPNFDNEILYHSLACDALELIYSTVPTETMAVIKRDGNIILLGSSASRPIILDTILWPLASNLQSGDCLAIKRTTNDGIVMARNLNDTSYNTLTKAIGIAIDDNRLMHTDSCSPVKCDKKTTTGNFYSFVIYKDTDDQFAATAIKPVERDIALRHFDRETAVVYKTDIEQLHYVTEESHGTLNVTEDTKRVVVGDIIKLYNYTDSHRQQHIVGITAAPAGTDTTGMLKEVSGPLVITQDGGHIRDIIVDKSDVAKLIDHQNAFVKAVAVRHPDDTWHAVTVTPYT